MKPITIPIGALLIVIVSSALASAAVLIVPTVPFPTIQDAVDAAVDGDTIQIDAGTYVEDITVDKNLDFVGAGPGATFLEPFSGGSIIYAENIDYISVSGMHFESAGGAAVEVATDVDVEIYLFDSILENNELGLVAYSLNNIDIEVYNTLITNTNSDAIQAYAEGDDMNADIYNNEIGNTADGTAIYLGFGPGTNPTNSQINIYDNNLYDNKYGIYIEDGEDSGVVISSIYDNTLVNNGDPIYITHSMSDSYLDIYNNIIDGQGADGTGIFIENSDGLIDVSGSIYNNEISNCFGEGIYISTDNEAINASIHDNNVTNNSGNGIYISSADLLDMLLENNRVVENGWDGISSGISLSADSMGGDIHDNVITGNGYDGLSLEADSFTGDIYNNEITGNANNGLYANELLDSSIYDNTIESNGAYGLEFYGLDSTLINNQINTNQYGIFFTAQNIYLNLNVIENNVEYGVYGEGAVDSIFEDNQIQFNGVDGMFFDALSDNNELLTNSVCFNTIIDIRDNGDATGDENMCDNAISYSDTGMPPGACTYACILCGNSLLEGAEECDDGDTDDGDGCSAICTIETGYQCVGGPTGSSICTPICGDALVIGGEVCDDGALNGQPNQCNVNCDGTTPAVCGNGVIEDNEECDDGNTVHSDGCSDVCVAEVIGTPGRQPRTSPMLIFAAPSPPAPAPTPPVPETAPEAVPPAPAPEETALTEKPAAITPPPITAPTGLAVTAEPPYWLIPVAGLFFAGFISVLFYRRRKYDREADKKWEEVTS